jgi:hypothetical protein
MRHLTFRANAAAANPSSQIDRFGLALGFALMGGAVLAAAQAQDPAAAALIGSHLALCLTGAAQTGDTAGVWTFAGHCAACWAALGLTAAGAVLMLNARLARPAANQRPHG